MSSVNGQIELECDSELYAASRIHFKKTDRCPTHVRQPRKFVVDLNEMLMPDVPPGIEQSNHLARQRINGAQIWALKPVAQITRQRQVLNIVQAAVLDGNDVFEVEGEIRKCELRNSTVLATVLGAKSDQLADERGHEFARRDRASRALARRMPSRSIASMNCSYSRPSASVSRPSFAFSRSSSTRCFVSASSWKWSTCSADAVVRPSAHGASTRSSMFATDLDMVISLAGLVRGRKQK